ncbi:MAG: AAA family ATPase [Pirellulales bacterium]|nr:AAA family ATPase [Pirellulales bacterium]
MKTAVSEDLVMDPLREYFDRFGRENPFFANRVSDPAGGEVNVATIHGHALDELVGYAEQVRRERIGIGVVVWGEAGIGKSHLLARFCRWAEEEDRAGCVFLHNIQASPARLPRYVLKCVIHRLVGGRARQFFDTPLCRSIHQTVPEPFALAGGLPGSADARAALFRFTERLVGADPHGGADAYRVAEVLFRFYLSAYCGKRDAGGERSASLAVRWLSGDELAPEEAAKLGMGTPTAATALADNQAIDSVLAVLADLAWHGGRPLVLCFDQVDNLAREQIEALTQFLHTLIDHSRNLLVVTSGVQSKLLEFVEQGTVLRAAWERIAQDTLRLQRIGLGQARQLLEARLEQFLEPFVTVAEIKERVHEDSLFPLGSDWLAMQTAGLVEIRPRDALNWARQRWRRQQERVRTLGGRAWLENWSGDEKPSEEMPAAVSSEPAGVSDRVDLRVAARIEEQIAQRRRDPSGLPPDIDNLAELVRTLLGHCAGREGYVVQDLRPAEPTRARRQPAYHLVIRSGTENGSVLRTAVTYVASSNPAATALALRRMLEDAQMPERILLVSEERQPLNLGEKGREYLSRLEALGHDRFEHMELAFREYVELDALQATVGDARSGDLEVELPGGRFLSLGEEEVIASLHRQDRFRQHRLLGKLLLDRWPGAAEVEGGVG